MTTSSSPSSSSAATSSGSGSTPPGTSRCGGRSCSPRWPRPTGRPPPRGPTPPTWWLASRPARPLPDRRDALSRRLARRRPGPTAGRLAAAGLLGTTHPRTPRAVRDVPVPHRPRAVGASVVGAVPTVPAVVVAGSTCVPCRPWSSPARRACRAGGAGGARDGGGGGARRPPWSSPDATRTTRSSCDRSAAAGCARAVADPPATSRAVVARTASRVRGRFRGIVGSLWGSRCHHPRVGGSTIPPGRDDAQPASPPPDLPVTRAGVEGWRGSHPSAPPTASPPTAACAPPTRRLWRRTPCRPGGLWRRTARQTRRVSGTSPARHAGSALRPCSCSRPASAGPARRRAEDTGPMSDRPGLTAQLLHVGPHRGAHRVAARRRSRCSCRCWCCGRPATWSWRSTPPSAPSPRCTAAPTSGCPGPGCRRRWPCC